MGYSAELPPSSSTVGPANVPWKAKDVGFGIIGFFVVFITPQIPLALLIGDAENPTRNEYVLAWIANGVAFAGIFGVALFFSVRRHHAPMSTLGFKMPTLSTLGWGALALVAAFVVAFIYGLAMQAFGWEQKCDDQIPIDIRRDALLLGLFSAQAVVMAPLAEETFFRGFSFAGLGRSWGTPAGIVLSGALFGAAHLLGNPYLYKTFLLFSLVGCIFAIAYWRSGNLWSSIGTHFVFNLISVISIAATECDPS